MKRWSRGSGSAIFSTVSEPQDSHAILQDGC
jgi:hypothetical protein